jgi:hypothetical protein
MQSHQKLLIPHIARLFATTFVLHDLVAIYSSMLNSLQLGDVAGFLGPLQDLHSSSCGLKGVYVYVYLFMFVFFSLFFFVFFVVFWDRLQDLHSSWWFEMCVCVYLRMFLFFSSSIFFFVFLEFFFFFFFVYFILQCLAF